MTIEDRSRLLREKADAILEAYQEELATTDDRLRVPGLWIFRRTPDHARFEAKIVDLAELARKEGYEAGVASMADEVGWTCVCRCKAHRVTACPKCQETFGCPVHSEVDPRVLRPEILKDPETLAKAIWTEASKLETEMGENDEPPPEWISSWASTPETTRRAMIEAVRRVVSIRVK